jgi:hypothetical protein
MRVSSQRQRAILAADHMLRHAIPLQGQSDQSALLPLHRLADSTFLWILSKCQYLERSLASGFRAGYTWSTTASAGCRLSLPPSDHAASRRDPITRGPGGVRSNPRGESSNMMAAFQLPATGPCSLLGQVALGLAASSTPSTTSNACVPTLRVPASRCLAGARLRCGSRPARVIRLLAQPRQGTASQTGPPRRRPDWSGGLPVIAAQSVLELKQPDRS